MTVASQGTTLKEITAQRGTKYFEEDQTIPYRLVGSHEYQQAIDALSALAGMSTAEEIKVYDKLITEKPEFSFHSGAHTGQNIDPELTSASGEYSEDFDARFRKRSLAWLVGLARAELGATISMYGKTKAPFLTVGTDFGAAEMVEILVDDTAAHLKSLSNDPKFEFELNKRQADSDTLAYLRRLNLVNDMMFTIAAVGDPQLLPEIELYAAAADAYSSQLSYAIEKTTGPYAVTVSDQSMVARFRDREHLSSCQKTVEASYNRKDPRKPTYDRPNVGPAYPQPTPTSEEESKETTPERDPVAEDQNDVEFKADEAENGDAEVDAAEEVNAEKDSAEKDEKDSAEKEGAEKEDRDGDTG